MGNGEHDDEEEDNTCEIPVIRIRHYRWARPERDIIWLDRDRSRKVTAGDMRPASDTEPADAAEPATRPI